MKLAILGLCVLALAGCGSDDLGKETVLVDVSGAWGGTVRNDSNSCPGNFNVDETNNIQLTVTQDVAKVSVKLEGVVGVLLNFGFGTDTFNGTLTSDAIDASLLGQKSVVEGTCTFKWTASLKGSVRDAKMNGTVTYKPNPQSGDCSAIASCSRVQSFDVEKGKVLTDAGLPG